MNTNTTRNSAFALMALICLTAVSGCSQKSSSEEIATQVKAALAEEKAKEQAAAHAPSPATKAEASKPAATSKHVAQVKPVPADPVAPAQNLVCDNCGVVISVKEVELKGKGSGLGVIAGGVAGGVVGNQVGQGTGRDLATIAGVIGGAVAGNTIEENVKKTRVFDVAVRMENGEERVLRYKTSPGVMSGDKVKVEGAHLVRR